MHHTNNNNNDDDENFVQKLQMRKKLLQVRSSGTSSVGNCFQRVVGSDSKFRNYLMN